MRIISFVPTTELTELSERALAFAEAAGELGHSVMLLGLARGTEPPATTPLGEAADERGVTFRFLLQRMAIDPGLLGQMEAVVRRFDPDLYQSYGTRMAVLSRQPFAHRVGWQAILPGEAPLASDSMGGGWAARRLGLAMFRRADQVIVEKEESSASVAAQRIPRERIFTMPREVNEIERARAILELADKVRRR